MKSGEKYEEIELVKKDKNDEKLSDGEYPEMELGKKDGTDEKPSDGEESEMELMRKSRHDVKQTDGEDEEMELVKKDEEAYDGEDPELELMEKSEHGVKQTDGEDDEELVLLRKRVNDLESTVEAAKSALELIKRIDKVAEEEPIAATILPMIKASHGDESTSVSHLKEKEISLRDEYTHLIAALRRELADYIVSQELSKVVEDLHKKEKENVNLSCQLTAKDLQEKKLKKHCDDLKMENEDMLAKLGSKEEELNKVANQKRALISTLSNKEKAINNLNEALKNHEVEKANLLEQLAAQDKELSKLHEALENYKKENDNLIEELAAKDKILKEHEESLPKINQDSLLQWVHDSLPICMRPCLAPKGSITGDELGTFMGSLVTTTAYNVTYSNSDLKAYLFWNSLANLIGSMFGQICNNVVTQMSQTDVKKEGAKKTFKTIGKSVFWILLGGLIPMFAGGFIKKYQIRLVVAAASAFAMQCISATLWKQSYQIPTWQPVFIVVLGIIGIGIAAGIPHLVKVVSEKK